ncbi:MAG TPA: hypothetical protein VGK99_19370 [Acidobacteriota bacterium]|jgi:hypothetical protein
MNRRRYISILLLIALACTPGCLFHRKKKDQSKPKVYDVLGTVQTVAPNSISVQTDKGLQIFAMNNATVRGSEFKPGMYVHVYYNQNANEKLATMIVEKVKK